MAGREPPRRRGPLGEGFGGQNLLVLPDRDAVAVVNAWNVFGRPTDDILDDVVAAISADP